jgi:hypothetical protein
MNVGGAGLGSEQRADPAQVFAFLAGVIYLFVGLAGFAVTGLSGFVTDGEDALLGLDLNVFHNFVHLAIGGYLLVVSRLTDPVIAQGVLIGGGLVFVLAALLGFMDNLQILSVDSGTAADNFLHLFSGLAALIFGLIGAGASQAEVPARGLMPETRESAVPATVELDIPMTAGRPVR